MVERVKMPEFKTADEYIEEAKDKRDLENAIFDEFYKTVDNWVHEGLFKDFVFKDDLMKEVSSLKTVKRFNIKYKGKGLPEKYWDFFEMWDFICYIRDKNPDTMMVLLKDYKGGKYGF